MIFGSIPGLIASMSTGPITVWRAGAPSKSAAGVWDRGARVAVVIDPAVVHTQGGSAIDRLPEALRSRETIKLVAAQKLHAAADGETPDHVEHAGAMYEVQSVTSHAVLAGVWTTYATRLEPDA